MGKQLDTEIIKGDPMQYYLLLQHLTENQVLKQLEALPESIIVEGRQSNIQYRRNRTISRSCRKNMIKQQ
jgi:hypothetical protein